MQNSIARADYDAMVDRIGQEEADRRVREYGWEVLPAEGGMKAIPASQVNNLLGQGGLSMAMGGGDKVEDEDPNVADEDAADQDAAGSEGQYAGGLDAINLSNPQDISKAILKNARAQKQYYDQLAEQIKNRRYGPSVSEKLFALSAALAAPTQVRGFSGTMANVMPVLQKFGELRRTGEEQRQEALQELAKQRMQLAQGDIRNALLLQKMQADYLKSGKPKFRMGSDNAFYPEPGTGGYPEMPQMDSYGNYVITDRRQLNYLPVNTRVIEPGQDPTKPKYVPERGKGE